ncbi:MAG: twin-arginine translocase subunit TatC [Planctomycetota bacterium]|nr:twin-arginine translocase subunit TatC [Planctomycetota bacterium]
MTDPELDMPRMTLPEHLDELRRRILLSVIAIVIGMVASFFFYKQLWDFIRVPFDDAVVAATGELKSVTAIDPGEGFLQVLKLCFITGIVFVSPIVLWQLWGFIAAGLYSHERRYVRIFFPVSMVLFVMGLVVAYMLLIPFGMRFLIGWNEALDIETDFRMSAYLSTCLTMLFGMGLIFQLPLVMLFLQASGIVARKTFIAGWRWAVVLAFVVGMVLTDPSPVTQLVMAIPVVGLYFLGIWGGRFAGENAETFRWWKAWPVVLALLGFAAMLVYRDELNELAVDMFGVEEERPPKEAPEEPGGDG